LKNLRFEVDTLEELAYDIFPGNAHNWILAALGRYITIYSINDWDGTMKEIDR